MEEMLQGEELAAARRAGLREEIREYFGVALEEIEQRYQDSVAGSNAEWERIVGEPRPTPEKERLFCEQSIWRPWTMLNWAECEWHYGWPPHVLDWCWRLEATSLLDFGAGMGEIALWVAENSFSSCPEHGGPLVFTLADLRSPSRDFLAWRLWRRRDIWAGRGHHRMELVDPEMALAAPGLCGGPWDVTLALEVLEHIPDAPATLGRLLALTRKGLIISGVTGRPEDDADQTHVFRDSLEPVLEEAGWACVSAGGLPAVYVREGIAWRFAPELGLLGKARAIVPEEEQ